MMSAHLTAEEFYLMIGAYGSAEKDTLFLYKFNSTTGKASFLQSLSGIEDPSFLTFSPDGNDVYAISEINRNMEGLVYAYHLGREKNQLQLINKAPSEGDAPCNIITDKMGKRIYVSNYFSGSVVVLDVKEDGQITPPQQIFTHSGHSINKERQSSPHVHSVLLSPDEKYLFAADLGTDQVYIYERDEKNGRLQPASDPVVSTIPGSGPRHLEITANGKYLYLIQELGGQITVFKQEDGKLVEVQVLSNLPQNHEGRIWAADIHLSPDEKFLYTTNREALNDIVTFKVDKQSGKLTYVDRQNTGGKIPRNFMISPDGKWVLIGHEESDEITVFERDMNTGLLTRTPNSIEVPHAVCLKMAQ